MPVKEKERPFLSDFQIKIDSPKVPGKYNEKKQIREDDNGKPLVEVKKIMMGTTRTGEHNQEC